MNSTVTTPRRNTVGRAESFMSQTNNLDRSYQSIISTVSRTVTYSTLRERALARRVLFEDTSFPANDTSLQIKYKSFSEPIEWKRPHEISKRPSFTAKPTSFDIHPGTMADTWLLPALSCLTLAPSLIKKCIPEDQAFDETYAGIFRFRFWRCGEWLEVVIDDRLPTHNGKLLFMRNANPNEFWVALLEKAYAKLYGSYAAIQGTMVNWALQNLTGGISDSVLYRDNRNILQKTIDISMAGSTLLAATIAGQGTPHRQFPNGLITGRAYSVTGYAEFPHQGGNAVLVRLRNPWGKDGYTGTWDNRSTLWDTVSADIKTKLGVESMTENEFWMPYVDFSRLFTNLELCHLPPEAWNMEPKLKHRLPWKAVEAHRQWRKGYNAGGDIKSNLFSCNNQFFIQIKRQSCVVLSLMQKYRLMGEERNFVSCGCHIYQAPGDRTTRLQMGNFIHSRQVASTGARSDREIVRIFTLPAGSYVIVPFTAKPGTEGKYCLRIFTDARDSLIRELDDPDTASFTAVERDLEADTLFVLRKRFLRFCNKYDEVDGMALKEILAYKPQSTASKVLCCEPDKDALQIQRMFLSPDTCKAAVTIEDKEMTGRLNYNEFLALVKKLLFWQGIFRKYEVGNGSVVDTYSLRNALRIAGFSVSNRVLEALVLMYAAKEFMNLEGFINSAIKLHVAHRTYTIRVMQERAKRISEGGTVTSHTDNRKYLQELLRTSIYS